ncbi:MAG: DUF5615 family PIN-like protein [Nanoarchaeota archaeon]
MSSSSKPKLYSDENIPDKVVRLLEEEGFDVKKAAFRSDDEEIAEEAKSEGRVILSFDRHLGNILLFPPEKYAGIIFIRIRPPLIDSVFPSLMNLFKSVKLSEFKGRLFTLTPFGFRDFPKLKRIK